MAEEEDPDLAAAIRASLGLPPLPPSNVNNDEPLFLPSDDDDDGHHLPEEEEERSERGSGSEGSEIPDFSDEEAVDRYFSVVRDQAQPPPPPPPVAARRPSPPPVQHQVERRVPGWWNGAWRGQSRLLDNDDDGGGMQQEVQEEEDGPEYRLALRRSREEEEKRIAALSIPELVPDDVDEEDEEEMMRRAIEASMKSVTPPPQSDEIDEEEEDRFNEELRKAIEESRKERDRRGESGEGGSNGSAAAAAAAAGSTGPPVPLFGRLSTVAQVNSGGSNSSATLVSSPTRSSRPSSSPPTVVAAPPPPPPSAPQPTASTSTASSSMFGGLSRAELEQERLARANKRQLTDDGGASSSSSQQPPSKKPRPSNTTARIMTFGDLPQDDDGDRPSGGGNGGGGGAATGSAWGGGGGSGGGRGGVETVRRGERFWDGEKGYGFTTNRVCTEPGKYFGLPELIGDTSTLKLAIISTYCFEASFVAELFPTSVPTVLVSHPPDPQAAGKSYHGTSVDGIWSCYPFLPVANWGGSQSFRGTCHMKFMLLFYGGGRLRVVIMSANFMRFDFESIENGVWVQDFHPRTTDEVVKTDFGNQWEMILNALGIPKTFRLINPVHHGLPFQKPSDIHKWDFSSVKVRLVASLSGKKEGHTAMESVGQCRLGKILRQEGWVPGDGRALKSLEAQGSSLGNYSTKWMNDIFRNASGQDPRNWLGRVKDTSKYPGVKIIFPTLSTIDATYYGRRGGGTFFCDDKKWKDATQGGKEGTKGLFYDAVAKRGAVLMHIKILVAIFEPSSITSNSKSSTPSASSKPKGKGRAPSPEIIELSGSETEDEDGQPLSLSKLNGKGKAKEVAVLEEKRVAGWLYMGSHNFTPSAWGNLSMSKDGTPCQDGANYELGIIMPLTSDDPQAEANKLTTWKRPAPKYSSKDVPWMQKKNGGDE